MAKQDDYIKTALRLPRALHIRLTDAAEARGNSLNAEFVARLEGSFAEPPESVFQLRYMETQLLARQLDLASIARLIVEVKQQISDESVSIKSVKATLNVLSRVTAKHMLSDEAEKDLNQAHQVKLTDVLTEIRDRHAKGEL